MTLHTAAPGPCINCGTILTVDASGRLVPDEEHQQQINKQKYFEVALVVLVILVGFGYFAISTGGQGVQSRAVLDLAGMQESALARSYEDQGAVEAMDRSFHRYQKMGSPFQEQIDWVIAGDGVVEGVLFTVFHDGEQPFPEDAVAEAAVQSGLDGVAAMAEEMIPGSSEGLVKAVNTTTSVHRDDAYYLKGVAQTANGWKVTYMAYRSYEENGQSIPLLFLAFQLLDKASEPEAEAFNQALFATVGRGEVLQPATLSREVL